MCDTLINDNIEIQNGIITDSRLSCNENQFFVYMYENLENNKKYIGKTNNIKKRHAKHISVARRKTKSEFMFFHKALNKYGIDKFCLKIIDIQDSEEKSYDSEKYFIEYYKTNNKNFGYNLCLGGAHANSGRMVSEETRNKISKIHKGKILSQETKNRISSSKSGNKLSDETKRKMSLAKIGKKHSDESREKIRKHNLNNSPRKGKKVSDTVKQKIRENLSGSKNPASKITEDTAKDIKYKYYVHNLSVKNISDILNISINIVKNIAYGRTWKHIIIK